MHARGSNNRPLRTRVAAVLVALATAATVCTVAAAPAGAAPAAAGGFTGITPVRIFDSSSAPGGGCVGGGTTRVVPVTGVGSVPRTATAVSVNVTVFNATAFGALTVFPGGARPLVTTVAYQPGVATMNTVTVSTSPVAGSTVRTISLFASSGCVEVRVDVLGHHTGGAARPGGFAPASPVARRVFATSAPLGNCVAAGAARNVKVAGLTTPVVPANAAAVMMTVTAASPSANGAVWVWPAGTARPTPATAALVSGRTKSFTTTVRPGAGGQVSVAVSAGTTCVTVDVVGHYVAGAPETGGRTAIAPTRLLDTRLAGPCVRAGTPRVFRASTTAGAVELSLTALSATASGTLQAVPAGATQGAAGVLIYGPSTTTTNTVQLRLGDRNEVVFRATAGTVCLVVDIVGRFSAADAAGFFPGGVVSTYSGLPYRDGTGLSATFATAAHLDRDAAGNVFVADPGTHTVRKVTPAGVVTTVAGQPGVAGSADGAASVATLRRPAGVAVDAAGNLYVADTGNHTVRKVAPTGTVTTLAGSPEEPGLTSGTGAAARFTLPEGIDVAADGTVLVADTGNNAVRRVTAAGEVTTLAGPADSGPSSVSFPTGSGYVNGAGAVARFARPRDLVVVAGGNVVVADTDNHVLRLVNGTTGATSLFAGVEPGVVTLSFTNAGSTDGALLGAASFRSPAGVGLDTGGAVLVADTGNARVRRVGATVTTLAVAPLNTTSFPDGPLGRLVDVTGLTATSLAVGDGAVGRVTLPSGATSRFAGLTPFAAPVNGTGPQSSFVFPRGITVDPGGTAYVTDNQTVRTVSPTGTTVTVAGASSVPGYVNGARFEARFNNPSGLVVAPDGTVFVADTDNHVVRRIAPNGAVSTVAGAAPGAAVSVGSNDGVGTAARFLRPEGIARDSAGNLYVADTGNSLIRRISPTGVVTTLAGLAGSSGSTNGTGATARFGQPARIAVDTAGNLYVTDFNFPTVRKVTPAGVVTTLAGSAAETGDVDGAAGAARFGALGGITVAADGNLVVADNGNQRLRRVASATGAVSTLTGRSPAPFNEQRLSSASLMMVDGAPTRSVFGNLIDVAADGVAGFLVVDRANRAPGVRRVI